MMSSLPRRCRTARTPRIVARRGGLVWRSGRLELRRGAPREDSLDRALTGRFAMERYVSTLHKRFGIGGRCHAHILKDVSQRLIAAKRCLGFSLHSTTFCVAIPYL